MPDDFYRRISKNLTEAIASNPHLRQKDVAAALSVSQSSVSGWLSGAQRIDLLHLVQLCELLHVSLDAITGITLMEQTAAFTALASQLSDHDKETVLTLMKIMAAQNKEES